MFGRDQKNLALMLLGATVAVAVVAAIAINGLRASGSAGAPAAVAPAQSDEPSVRIQFAAGSSALSQDAAQALTRIAGEAREQARAVLVTGYYTATGDRERNQELAAQRALAVGHALEADGVEPGRLSLEPPVATGGAHHNPAVHRVEVRLQ